MPVQTASLRFYEDTAGHTHVVVSTPSGHVDFHLGVVGYTNLPVTTTSVFEPTPESRPKKVTAKKQKRASMKQETDIMEALGGRRQVGSGALAHLKGDGRVRDKYRVEAKYTRSNSYRLTRQELNKLRGECEGSEIPVFVIDYVDPETGGSPDRWVVVEFERFRQMDYRAPQHAARQPSGPR
jgi:hypothetical protein